ncbi:conserved hypothetical protein [Xanthomonas campestris pv. raphani 756C]|nr:conserved hypothetical protein [Xanthomonas campestris pv. raphani 756C]
MVLLPQCKRRRPLGGVRSRDSPTLSTVLARMPNHGELIGQGYSVGIPAAAVKPRKIAESGATPAPARPRTLLHRTTGARAQCAAVDPCCPAGTTHQLANLKHSQRASPPSNKCHLGVLA